MMGKVTRMSRELAVLSAVVIAVLAPPSAGARQQRPAGDTRPAFEAATIKLAPPDIVRSNRVISTSPNRLFIPGMPLTSLVYAAYGDGGFNTSMSVRGGPDWANRTVFTVEGVAAGPATSQERQLMLQTLLEQRLALKLRRDAQNFKALTLVPDRSDGTLGPKVQKWSGNCSAVRPALVFEAPWQPALSNVEGRLLTAQPSPSDDPDVPYCPTGYRNGGILVDGATMSTVAEVLSLPPARALLGMMTYDRTGLAGRYTMELDFLFPATGPGAPAAPPEFAGPSLSTAVREQWGLRLVPGEGTLKIFVIESAQLPAEN
jgi:uncharacterized protein (TIGR03435 family)